jgi:hypothetical protein
MLQSSCLSVKFTVTSDLDSQVRIPVVIQVETEEAFEGTATYTAEPGPSRARVAPVPLKMDFIPPSAYSFLTTSKGPV